MPVFSLEKEVCAAGLVPVHAHESPHACLVVRGAMFDRKWRSRSAPAGPGDVLVNPGGADHAIEVGGEGLVCVVAQWSARRDIGAFQSLAADRPREDLARLVDDLSTDNPAGRAIVRNEIIAEIDRAVDRRPYVEAPAWLRESRAALGAEGETMSVMRLARAAGVHRATLAQRFRAAYGMAPEEYRMLVKLERAAALLAAGVRPASAALEAGFFDQAHMNRAWRRYLGGSPGGWKAARATIVQDAPALLAPC